MNSVIEDVLREGLTPKQVAAIRYKNQGRTVFRTTGKDNVHGYTRGGTEIVKDKSYSGAHDGGKPPLSKAELDALNLKGSKLRQAIAKALRRTHKNTKEFGSVPYGKPDVRIRGSIFRSGSMKYVGDNKFHTTANRRHFRVKLPSPYNPKDFTP